MEVEAMRLFDYLSSSQKSVKLTPWQVSKKPAYVSAPYISNSERAEANLSSDTIYKIIYATNLNELFGI